jgi:hypothetical protein
MGNSVVSVRGDTIVLALTRTRPSYVLAQPPAAPHVTLVPGPDVRLETLAFDPGRTTRRTLGTTAFIATILLVAFVVGIQAAYGG